MDDSERGGGVVALEESKDKDKHVAILTLRNKIGALIFQAQVMKNISKLTKKKVNEPNKVQRMITVVGDKEGKEEKVNGEEAKASKPAVKKGLLKCTITFKEEKDCEKFKEAFVKLIAELPEIIKPSSAN